MKPEHIIEAARALPELKSMPKREFVDWLASNPRVYGYFRKFAREAMDRGRTHFSAYMIRERVRWYVNVEYKGEFKVNNNLTPYIARLLAAEFPELRDIFTFKRSEIGVNGELF